MIDLSNRLQISNTLHPRHCVPLWYGICWSEELGLCSLLVEMAEWYEYCSIFFM